MDCSVRDRYGLTAGMLLDTRITNGKARKSTGLLHGTRYSMPVERYRVVVSRQPDSINQQRLTQIWNFLVFLNVD